MIIENKDSLNNYMREINKFDLIDRDKEREILKRIKEGDIKAQDELIMANTKFVMWVAKQYNYSGVDYQDLVSEGNIGLIIAAKKFDMDNNTDVKFISYAVWWIRQSITKYINEHSRTIRIPVNKINDINKEIEELSDEEMTTKYSIPTSVKSIDAPIGASDEGTFTLADVLASDEDYFKDIDNSNLNAIIEDALNELSPRESDIIRKYFGLEDNVNWALETIAEEYDLTKERVRQIKTKAIRKLRHNSDLFYEYF